jgi:putative transposase
MTALVSELADVVGVAQACAALEQSRSTYYRRSRPAAPRPNKNRPTPARALGRCEQQKVIEVLHSDRFVDQAPAQVVATLLGQGLYYCSTRTMYRILGSRGEVLERRNQLRHPRYVRPELLATGPNQVWSWDITKLRAVQKWTYYYLYVLLDIFSRYVVGWMLSHRESGELAAELLQQSYHKQDVDPEQLTVHADRGSAPTSKTLKQMMVDLGVKRSHSRPRVSNDNPFSESNFHTVKSRPNYPNRFGCYEDAVSFCQSTFDWYNNEHHHSGIAMLTPAQVHYSHAEQVLAERQRVLDAAHAAHPERFVNGPPQVPSLPQAVWINPPEDKSKSEIRLH